MITIICINKLNIFQKQLSKLSSTSYCWLCSVMMLCCNDHCKIMQNHAAALVVKLLQLCNKSIFETIFTKAPKLELLDSTPDKTSHNPVECLFIFGWKVCFHKLSVYKCIVENFLNFWLFYSDWQDKLALNYNLPDKIFTSFIINHEFEIFI